MSAPRNWETKLNKQKETTWVGDLEVLVGGGGQSQTRSFRCRYSCLSHFVIIIKLTFSEHLLCVR